jgi:bifunctional enzyme CysN/CysC
VAVLLIDARQGVLTQTRRHAYLVSLVGIKQVILAVNKMDLVSYRKDVFDAIVGDFNALAQPLGFKGIMPIPLSALKGENITERSGLTPWYQGPTLMGSLETLQVDKPTQKKAIFPVQWVSRPNDSFRGFSGTLAAGQLVVGAAIRVTASGQTTSISRIVTADGDLDAAQAGDADARGTAHAHFPGAASGPGA